MNKDFDAWNEIKKNTHHKSQPKFYHEREIWWCSLGINIGAEQDGKGPRFQRPVVILKGLSKDTCQVVPLTTSKKRHKMRISIGKVKGKESSALISQSRVIDTRRLTEKIGFLGVRIFVHIRKAIKDLL